VLASTNRPSALHHIADAGRYLDNVGLELFQKLDELNEVMPKVDELGKLVLEEPSLRTIPANKMYPVLGHIEPENVVDTYRMYGLDMRKLHKMGIQDYGYIIPIPEDLSQVVQSVIYYSHQTVNDFFNK
jgi:hypothetical protein